MLETTKSQQATTWKTWILRDTWNAESLSKLLSCPVGLLVVALVQRELPSGAAAPYIIASWVFGAACVGGALLGFSKNPHLSRSSAVVVATALVLLAGNYLYIRFGLAQVTVAWPTRVFAHEAVVGGTFQNIEPANQVVRLYVCTKTEDGPQCFLDQHRDAARLQGGIWESMARFGNEDSENNVAEATLDYWVVPVTLPLGAESALPAAVKGTAFDLVPRLERIPMLKPVGRPHRVERIMARRSTVVIRKVLHSGGKKQIDVPSPRQPFYFVCPPITVNWSSVSGDKSPAYVELWRDGSRGPSPADAVIGYALSEWPKGVTRVEIKISHSKGRGPYDSVYLQRACGQ